MLLRATAAAFLCTVGCAAPPPEDSAHPLNPPPQGRATELLARLFSPGSGHWDPTGPGSGWSNVGYWQEANLAETMCNYLFATRNATDPATKAMQHTVAGAVRRSFRAYPGQWLVTTPPESTSYDDLLWWGLAYIRAHELCLEWPDLMPCTVPVPVPVLAVSAPPPPGAQAESCNCIPCGSVTPAPFNGGQCSQPKPGCSSTSAKNNGCYTNNTGGGCIAGCNCSALGCVAVPPRPPTLLATGRLIFDFVYNMSWNEDFCNGGYAWALGAQNYKNCVTNQQGVLAASKLALLLPEGAACDCKAGEAYTKIALRTSSWLQRAPMRDPDSGNLFNDGLYCSTSKKPNNVTCTNDGGPIWTYCAGLPLGYMKENQEDASCRESARGHTDDGMLRPTS